ncbi:MAG: penicillin-binding protein 2 [Patescibacteria group bacterium]|nr:penicillin-binding protein 2 [Patescibacteria group bacterium]
MSSRTRFSVRIRLIASLIIGISLIFIIRLYFLQVVHGKEYRAQAESEYVKQSQNQIDRGSIFFTAKDSTLISAASIASGDTVAVNPQLLKDPASAYRTLKKYFPDLDETVFMGKATNKDVVYAEIERQVPADVGNKVIAENIKGVQVLKETWRFYPGGNLAGQTIGFLAYGPDGRTLLGQYGLERYYDEALSHSTNGLYVNFFADLFTNLRAELSTGSQSPGADLVISIEPTVQSFLEDQLKKYNDMWHPKTAGAIIMDPSTGEILAMAATPSFDPNNFKDADPNTFRNPLVQNDYEFGSIVKALTMAAGIDSGAVTPTTTYNDTGCITLDKKRICNYDLKARGVIPMQQILSQSLNVGAAWVENRMGSAIFTSYLKKYGIEEETGIDLPGEASPLVANLSSPRQVEYATASFGQGIALTPVAMTRALATLADHGAVPSPHVGLELDYGGGLVKKLGWAPPRQAITPQTADTVTRMLVNVVDNSLANGKAKIPEYSVAAKTGTAQIEDPTTHEYYPDRYLHSFFGYFPAYNARFIVFFYALEPQGAQYASETWTKPFSDTVHFLINYYHVPPDRAPTSQ